MTKFLTMIQIINHSKIFKFQRKCKKKMKIFKKFNWIKIKIQILSKITKFQFKNLKIKRILLNKKI